MTFIIDSFDIVSSLAAVLPVLFLVNGTTNYSFMLEKGINYTTVLFSCNRGYTLEGDELIAFVIIGPDNVTYGWKGKAPKCLGKLCLCVL